MIACGACACSGGLYRNFSVLQGIDGVVPVDLYIPGCPPAPETLIEGIAAIVDRMRAGGRGDE